MLYNIYLAKNTPVFKSNRTSKHSQNPRVRTETTKADWESVTPRNKTLHLSPQRTQTAKLHRRLVKPQEASKQLREYCNQTIQMCLGEMMKIAENLLQEHYSELDSVLHLIEGHIFAMRRIIGNIQRLQLGKGQRQLVEDLTNTIISEMPRIQCFQMYTYYYVAKIMSFYRNPIQSILLYKSSKRLSLSEQTFRIRMKCYRGLGVTFLKLRPNLALLYLTKYLISAWKLNESYSELKAYDLLGKYYFYKGDLATANQFHSKMVQGHHEDENSQLRRLAINKFNSYQPVKKDNQFVVNSEEPEYAVSSDDEVFDVLYNQNLIMRYKEHDAFSTERKNNQKFAIRHLPKFDSTTDLSRRNKEFQLGNQNIRLQDKPARSDLMNNGTLDLSKLKISHTRQQLGQFRQQIFVQHLSPNRTLGQYQELELTKDNKSYKKANDLASYLEGTDKPKIAKAITKYQQLVAGVLTWLESTYATIKCTQANQSQLLQLIQQLKLQD